MEGETSSTTSVYLWNTPEATRLLEGITLAANDSQPLTELDTLTKGIYPVSEIDLQVSSQTTCSTCGAEFENTKEQRNHFKSDWHRFNLKQKLKGILPVSEDHFEDVAGDVSSISGTGSSDDSTDSENEEIDDGSKKLVSQPRREESDTDDEQSYHIEGTGRRHPRVFYKNASNELLSIYRCVIHSKKKQPETSLELIKLTKELPDSTKWAIFMSAGGHFAGAIFNGEKVVVHKTFHRYVVRAKRGTAQSLRDKQGHAPKSGGASLRRYNEAALTQEIQELISTTWKEELKTCARIFLRAPSFNRQMFFGKSAPLDKTDPRVRLIPLQTRRPTFKELHRVHDLLAEVVVYGKESAIEDHIKSSPKKSYAPQPRSKKEKIPQGIERIDDSSSSSSDEDVELQMSEMTIDTTELAPFQCTRKPRRRKNPKETTVNQNDMASKQPDQYDETETQLRNNLYTACKVGDEAKLDECLREINTLTVSQPPEAEPLGTQCTQTSEGPSSGGGVMDPKMKPDSVLNTSFGDKFTTLLHVASQNGHSKLISPLLQAGADPTNRDYQGQFPYVVSADKETKNEFRRFMGRLPDMYNYSEAQIPGPLTAEMENEKKAKEAEKKKAQRKARKERQKEQKAIDAQQRDEDRERQRYLNLSDREKRALAADKRLLAQKSAESEKVPVLSRCWQCATDITGKVPFEYFDYKFCTPKCLKDHKLANQANK